MAPARRRWSNGDMSTIVENDYRLIAEVVARYLRAADRRDSTAMSAVFWADATTSVYYSGRGTDELLAGLIGAQNIGAAVVTGMAAHPALGSSHHTTLNPIVTVRGDEATYDAQFIVYSVRGRAKPVNGWPAGTVGAQGTITPIESGYFTSTLRRRSEGNSPEWRIQHHVIRHDLPYAFPR